MQLVFTFFSNITRLCLCAGLLFMLPAHAKRLALVMGNDNYSSVTKLQKAGNDATAMARELKAAGFTVQLHKDLNYRGMVKAVETFTNSITGGDEVVVFYAGHGVQIKTGSYLLPTDIEASSESEVEKTAYELNALTDKISEAKPALSLVMVDACRDNPIKANGRSVGTSRGLSAIEPPKGQIVVYSASRGQQALDRLSDKDNNPNGVFTREFIARMNKPGVKIEDLMREVQDAVESLAKTVSHEQRPAIYNEARGNFYFFGPTTVQMVAPPKPASVAPSSRPGKVDVLSLADLEREEATRKEWTAWQSRMNADFDKTAAFTGSPDLMVKAWERFLLVWSQDNPNSQDDDSLRSQAIAKRDAVRQINIQAQQSLPQTQIVLSAEKAIKDCADCPEMVQIPTGSFYMGSNEELNSRPVHRVNVREFFIGKTEVTQLQWKSVMGNTPSEFSQCGDACPVENVSWDDATEFTNRLSQKTGKQYRLPTEAEWEYASRAGSSSRWSFGDNWITFDEFAWTSMNSKFKTHPVATRKSNAFGLFDMYGNVWEWTQDCWNDNYSGAPVDGSAWVSGDCLQRVVRGGSWYWNMQSNRDGYFAKDKVGDRANGVVGLRVVRSK